VISKICSDLPLRFVLPAVIYTPSDEAARWAATGLCALKFMEKQDIFESRAG